MNKTLKRLIVILCLAILLPVAIYSGYEISTLSENEQELKEIYERQLEAVLFSVNLHSQDLVNSTVSKLENSGVLEALMTQQEGSRAELQDFFAENAYLEDIYLAPVASEDVQLFQAFEEDSTRAEFLQFSEALQVKHQTLIERLIKYRKAEFRKLQPLENVRIQEIEFSTLLFIHYIAQSPYICVLFLNTDEFCQQVLVPKLQLLSEQDFELSILENQNATSPIFTTSDSVRQATFTKEMWLLPTHRLGISPIGATLDSLTAERNRLNLLSLALMLIFILIGVFVMFRSLRKEMELAEQKSDFVSNVSHEIRTPLALISMFGETLMLGRVKTEEKKREYYEIITKEASRLTNIVNRILNFSKIEANKKEYQLSPIDLNALVDEVLYTYSFHIKNKGYTYSLDIKDIPLIMADREAVMESIVNLIDNAMKYSPDNKQFELTTGLHEDTHYAFISVKDSGIGISAQNIPYLFDKFYRVPHGNIHNAKGSGLGLSIVKHIMEAHEGEIKVTSKPNEGSEFKLIFKTKANQ